MPLMPSSVSIFSVTKLRPGQETTTRAAVIFMVVDVGERDGRVRLRRCEHRIDQVVDRERCAAAVGRCAAGVERVQEFGEHGAMRIVGERHRIGAAAVHAVLAGRFVPPVVPVEVELAAGERSRVPRVPTISMRSGKPG